jgi:O-antigen/teichoic acid export membrane protein
MYKDDRLAGLFRAFGGSAAKPSSLLQKIVATITALLVFGLALMFSVVLFAVVVTVGAIAWGYLWWKSRGLRKQMRENPPGGLVIEGEVIREVHTHEDGDGR